MARITFKRIDGDHKHLAPNPGEGDYPLKMDVYPSANLGAKISVISSAF